MDLQSTEKTLFV